MDQPYNRQQNHGKAGKGKPSIPFIRPVLLLLFLMLLLTGLTADPAMAAPGKADVVLASPDMQTMITALSGRKRADKKIFELCGRILTMDDPLVVGDLASKLAKGDTLLLARHCAWLQMILQMEQARKLYEASSLWSPAPRFRAFVSYLTLQMDFRKVMRGGKLSRSDWNFENYPPQPAFRGKVLEGRRLRLRQGPGLPLLKRLEENETFTIYQLQEDGFWVWVDDEAAFIEFRDLRRRVASVSSPW